MQIKSDSTPSFSSLTPVSTPTISNNSKSVPENTLPSNQLKVDPNGACDTGGPPTPTHSENQDDPEQKRNCSIRNLNKQLLLTEFLMGDRSRKVSSYRVPK